MNNLHDYWPLSTLKPNKGDTLLGQEPCPRHPNFFQPFDLASCGPDGLKRVSPESSSRASRWLLWLHSASSASRLNPENQIYTLASASPSASPSRWFILLPNPDPDALPYSGTSTAPVAASLPLSFSPSLSSPSPSLLASRRACQAPTPPLHRAVRCPGDGAADLVRGGARVPRWRPSPATARC
jgi:hypothetical protein